MKMMVNDFINQVIKASDFIKNLIPLSDIQYGSKAIDNHCICDIVILLNACFSGKFPNEAIKKRTN